MTKCQEYFASVQPLILRLNRNEIEDFLIKGSNLPGPRGNLELATAFAECCRRLMPTSPVLIELAERWINELAGALPPDDPREFLPFCALQGLGAAYCRMDENKQVQIRKTIFAAANDTKWRVREGAAIAFQMMEEQDFGLVRDIFEARYPSASLLERRAMMAALAHPPILGDEENVRYCLLLTDRILRDSIFENRHRKGDDFRVLRQGLEYAVSVFAAGLPGEGFDLLKKWASVNDPDIRRIIKSNLGKGRLTRKYQSQVDEVHAILASSRGE